MTQPMLQFSAEADRRLVACEVTSQRMIEWAVVAPPAARTSSRAPLNLALVLDRSGSMHGDKLQYVQQAACHVLDLLDERDRVAVVAYDDQVTLLAPGAPMTAANRAAAQRAIQALRPGGWTDLSGGWLEGCRELAAHQARSELSRALLLTDGLANRGITEIEALTEHARELRRRGIATSTFGVGLDFNEQLLEVLAEQGGGHFYYIDRPGEIPGVFRRELGELLSVVAREAFLSIAVPAGVGLELLGELPHERQGQRLRVFLGDLCAGERRMIYTRALVPPDAPGTSVVLRAELGYADLSARAIVEHAELAFAYVREAEAQGVQVNTGVLERASAVELAATTAQALRLERAGQRDVAQALVQQALAAAPHMPAPAAASYQALAEQLGGGLSEAERKQAHFASYKARQSRDK